MISSTGHFIYIHIDSKHFIARKNAKYECLHKSPISMCRKIIKNGMHRFNQTLKQVEMDIIITYRKGKL